MIMDSRVEFVNALQPAAGLIGNVIDTFTAALPAQGREFGAGQPIYWVAELLTAGTGGPMDVQLVTADNAALTTNPVILSQVTGIVVTTAQQKFAIALPQGTLYKQFLGVKIG